MDEKTKKINDEQKKAILFGEGPLLIVAGAGTGKTTVITERMAHLIKSGRANASEILALTFTEKAASEMQERVDIAMPYGYTDMWISTYHSFCDKILRDEALAIGLSTDYSLLTKPEAIQFIRDNLYKFKLDYYRPVGNPTKFIDGLVTHFSRLQDEDIAPQEYLTWAEKNFKKKQSGVDKIESAKWYELALSYNEYENLKASEGYMDFGDLIAKSLILFRKRPNVLSYYQKKFKYILVDEFQDTNYAQFELSLLLASKRPNITVVGDDDQSIYRFRGASVSNILQFRDRFPKAEVVVLTKNYRTKQNILDASYRLIQHNNPNRLETKEGVNKKLNSQNKGEGEILFFHERRVEGEAERVAKQIIKLVKEKKYSWGDFAILVRANNHATPFISALNYHSIPCQFLGPNKLFSRPEVIEIVSYLKILTDANDDPALYQVLSMNELEVEASDLAKLVSFSKRKNKKLFEVIRDHDPELVSEDTWKKLKTLVEIYNQHLNGLKNASSGKLLYEFVSKMGIMEKFIKPDTEEGQKRTANIGMLFEKIRNYEASHMGASVFDVVDWIELASEMGDSPRAAEADWQEENAVNIMTIHSAKGLEFPVVFLTNLVALRFPSVNRRDQIPLPDEILKEILPTGDAHEQEERRLFYVGMTRAKDHLYLTASDFYGETMSQPKKLSPFIFEVLGDSLPAVESRLPEQLSFLDFKPNKTLTKKEARHPIHFLSYSQIETFKMCPLHYKLKYILRIPTAPSGAQALGTSVHAALKEFYQKIKGGQTRSEKLLIKMLLKNWIDEGYVSREHEKDALAKAKKMLHTQFQEDETRKPPIFLEQRFTVPLKKVGQAHLKIGGVIDRVDLLPGGEIEIIDYKTGSAPDGGQKDVDKNLQLSLYALAATQTIDTLLRKSPEQIKLTLWYLDEGVKYTTTRTKEELIQVVDKIFDIRRQIEESDFSCSGTPLCQNCEYKTFCRQD